MSCVGSSLLRWQNKKKVVNVWSHPLALPPLPLERAHINEALTFFVFLWAECQKFSSTTILLLAGCTNLLINLLWLKDFQRAWMLQGNQFRRGLHPPPWPRRRKSRKGVARFFTHVSLFLSYIVSVFRNSIPLEMKKAWTFFVDHNILL